MPFVAHPYIFAAVAVFAVGIAIYEIVSHQRQRRHGYRRGGGGRGRSPSPPPPPPSPPHDYRRGGGGRRRPPSPPPSPPYDYERGGRVRRRRRPPTPTPSPSPPPSSPSPPPQRSTQKSTIPSSASRNSNIQYTENNVRKCIVNGPEKVGINETVSKQDKEQSSNFNNPNTNTDNYEKNVYEKILNDVSATTETKRDEELNKNIPDEDSDSENDVSEKDNAELGIGDVLSHSVTYSSGCNNLSQMKETEEEIYKKTCLFSMLDTLKMENEASEEVVCSSNAPILHYHQSEQNERINDNMKQNLCSACEENPIEVAAYPCGHCYLCSSCAEKIFRLHKKCSICFANIVEFKPLPM